MPPKKFYGVKQGKFGQQIYTSWADCSNAVTGYPNAIFKGFSIHDEAKQYVYGDNSISIQSHNNYQNNYTNESNQNLNNLKPNKLTNHIKILFNKEQEPAKILLDIDIKPYELYFNDIEKHEVIDIYTDGGCTNIATPNALACSGCYFPQFGVGLSVSVPKEQTNNRGELWAAIYTIYFTMHLVHGKITNIKKINIYTDSTYVENNLINKAKMNIDLCNLLRLTNETNKIPFNLVKVPGHSNNEGNNIADYLARTSHLQ